MSEFQRLKKQIGNGPFFTGIRKIENQLKWFSDKLEARSTIRGRKLRVIPEKTFQKIADYAKQHEFYRLGKFGPHGALVCSLLDTLPEFQYLPKDDNGPRRLVFVGKEMSF